MASLFTRASAAIDRGVVRLMERRMAPRAPAGRRRGRTRHAGRARARPTARHARHPEPVLSRSARPRRSRSGPRAMARSGPTSSISRSPSDYEPFHPAARDGHLADHREPDRPRAVVDLRARAGRRSSCSTAGAAATTGSPRARSSCRTGCATASTSRRSCCRSTATAHPARRRGASVRRAVPVAEPAAHERGRSARRSSICARSRCACARAARRRSARWA